MTKEEQVLSDWKQELLHACHSSNTTNSTGFNDTIHEAHSEHVARLQDLWAHRQERPLEWLDFVRRISSTVFQQYFTVQLNRPDSFESLSTNDNTLVSLDQLIQHEAHFPGAKYIFVWQRRMIETYIATMVDATKNATITMDKDHFEQWLIEERDYYQRLYSALEEQHISYHVLEYGRDFSTATAIDQTAARLESFLGVEPSVTTNTTSSSSSTFRRRIQQLLPPHRRRTPGIARHGVQLGRGRAVGIWNHARYRMAQSISGKIVYPCPEKTKKNPMQRYSPCRDNGAFIT